jgi:hypothetical protein
MLNRQALMNSGLRSYTLSCLIQTTRYSDTRELAIEVERRVCPVSVFVVLTSAGLCTVFLGTNHTVGKERSKLPSH